MKRLTETAQEMNSMQNIADLTSVFEGIASMRISKIKDGVLKSQQFFEELWNIYTQLRVDNTFRFGREDESKDTIDKELMIVITAEGTFTGDIDEKLINWMLTHYDAKKHDIIVIGRHGALQLSQAGVSFKKYFKMPESDNSVNVSPLIKQVQQYRDSTVYYQTYVSLMVQDVKKINLSQRVQEVGKNIKKGQETISEANYIFEPSTYAVVGYLERSMLHIMIGQLIFESKLAQYASRFKAMSSAHKKSDETITDLKTTYNRIRRGVKDERLKEVVNGLRKVHA